MRIKPTSLGANSAALLALGCLFLHLGCSTSESPRSADNHFLDGYNGQSIQQLISLKDSHRVDSLILALEEALERKLPMQLSEAERMVLTVEAMEREVNNGGYKQFFLNSPEFVPKIVRALELIQCPIAAKITADAIAALQLPAQVNPADVEHAASLLSAQSKTKLAECDSRYFAKDENIEQRLFEYIERHHQEIRIP